ncbi:MAG: CRISPR system precrRNA processing endoribonuclease RAMP protein Cas6 [Methanosarcinaceae archaeon]
MKFTRHHFNLSPVTGLILPPYKGSTLRGGFGHALKRVACMNRGEECTGCILRSTCVYSYIFETALFNGAHGKTEGFRLPHPFIIEPSPDGRQFYKTGDTLDFNLILVGQAINYIPHVILAFEELGKIGIGKNRGEYRDNGKYRLDKVISTGCNCEMTIYDGKSHVIDDTGVMDSADLLNASYDSGCSKITLRFLTPARIKYNGNFIDDLDFAILMRNLLRRLSWLAEIHCDDKWNLDWKGIISRAEVGVKTVYSDLCWHDWERYSNRQEKRLKMGGFMGDITFEGDLAEFLPFLRLGEYLHVGKGTVYGLGKYEIVGNGVLG